MTGSDKRVCEKNPATSTGFWSGNVTKCDCKYHGSSLFVEKKNRLEGDVDVTEFDM